MTVTGLPVISAPLTATVALAHATAIEGVSLSESGAVAGETFTVTLSDGTAICRLRSRGLRGGHAFADDRRLARQVNDDLATLTDTDASAATPDTISLTASDSLGNDAAPASIAVTVTGLPVISAPLTATVALAHATAIEGVSLSESGAVAGETFTVTLSDGSGDLSASGAGVSGAGTRFADDRRLARPGGRRPGDADRHGRLGGDPGHDQPDGVRQPGQSTRPGLDRGDGDGAAGDFGPGDGDGGAGRTRRRSTASACRRAARSPSETFTVTLSDGSGDLSASGAGVSGAGTIR